MRKDHIQELFQSHDSRPNSYQLAHYLQSLWILFNASYSRLDTNP